MMASVVAQHRQLVDIVEFLKSRYLNEPDSEPLTLEEIEKQCQNLSLDSHAKHWLASEAFRNNPRIDVQSINNVKKFHYKPPFQIKGTKGQGRALLNLLKDRHETCEGPITVDDVRDSTLKANTIIKKLKDTEEIMILTGRNKKEILFYNDRSCYLRVNPEFINSWRTIPIEGLDEEKIRRSLEDQGHRGFQRDTRRSGLLPIKPSKRRSRANAIKHNQHIADQLQVFPDKLDKI